VRAAFLLVCSLLPVTAAAQIAPCPDADSRPPATDAPLYRCADIVLHPINEAMVDPLTYAARLEARWSRPSEQVWMPYDEAALRADFRRLWDTGFLEDLSIEVIDEPYANGVMGKHVIFHLEERSRLKAVSYEPAGDEGSLKVDISKIEEALKDQNVQLKLDAFVDAVSIGRAARLIRELYANEGYGDALVVPERTSLPDGPKLVAVTFRITPGPRWRIREVVFDGNVTYSDATLRRQLKDNRARPWWLPFLGADAYRASRFPDDADRLREFYQNRGFPLVQVGAPQGEPLGEAGDAETRWVRLRVPLDEGARHRVGAVSVTGSTAVPDDAVRQLFGVKAGDAYSIAAIRKGLDRLREVYGALGYWQWSPDIDQEPRDTEAGEPLAAPVMDVTLGIDEGPRYFVNRINFTGNTKTRDAVMRREMLIGEGGVFSAEALAMSLRRMNQLGFLKPIERDSENVVVTPASGFDDRVDVTVKVEEENKNQMAFGAGVSQQSGFFGQLSFQTSNFIGRGETVSVSAQRGSLQSSYDLSLSSPYLLGRPITGGVQLFSRKTDYFLSSGVLGYSEVRAGVSLTAGFFVAPFTRLFLTATREQVETAVLDSLKEADASVLAGTPLFNTSLDEGKHQESRVSPSLVYNTVDNPSRPRNGLRLTGSADVALPVLGGAVEYLRPEVEAVVYRPVTARTALGVRAQMGWLFSRESASELPYYRRYFLGGEYELRGTELRSVGPLDDAGRAMGGTRSVLFNVEYYLDLGPVRTLAFHDAGQAFAESQPLTLRRLRTSSGVEARFTMPMLNIPIRVIYAWNFYRDSFQPGRTLKFGVGTTF
jgi:outer membrane protein insertion porin family